MNGNPWILGVDVGASKTDAALMRRSDGSCRRKRFSGANYAHMAGGFAAWRTFAAEIAAWLRAEVCAPQALAGNCWGIAGCDSDYQKSLFSAALRSIGFQDPFVVNDAALGLYAASENLEGICISNGSGIAVVGSVAGCELRQLAGLGELSGDRGGGFWLRGRVFEAVYREMNLGGEPTRLRPYLRELCLAVLREKEAWKQEKSLLPELRDDADGEKWIQSLDERSLHLAAWDAGIASGARLSRLAFRAAGEGDPAARRIFEEMGDCLAEAAAQLINDFRALRGEGEVVPIYLSGSVFRKAENACALDALRRALRLRSPASAFTLRLSAQDPVMGALRKVLFALGEENALPAASEAL